MLRPWRTTSRFLALPADTRRLLVRAWPTVLTVRAGLWLLPLSTLQRRLMRPVVRRSPAALAGATPDAVAWAVAAVSRRVPRATCLTQALALQRLLLRAGTSSTVWIGVGRTPEGSFASHAWVDCDGRILLDRAASVASLTPVASWATRGSGPAIGGAVS